MTPALALLLACAGNKTVESTPAPHDAHPAHAPDAEPSAPAAKPVASVTTTSSRAAVSEAYPARASAFAKRFHDALSGDGNAITSGVSAAFALGMLAEGAEGPARASFNDVFGGSLDAVQSDHARALAAYNDTPGVELAVVNGLWTGEGLELPAPVRERLAMVFAASPSMLPFRTDPTAAAKTIDAWTTENTGGLIPTLFTPADLTNARLVLANAVAFKGQWKQPFDASLTTDGAFQTPEGSIQTAFMTRSGMKVPYTEGANYKAVMLPYTGDLTALAVIVPNEGSSLADAADGLSADVLAELAGAAPLSVDVHLPRFTIRQDHDLVEAAGPLGLKDVFATEYTGFGEGLFVSKAIQKAVIEVSEEGTEAAAVTGITMKRSLTRTFTFDANRPFLFAVWHVETKTPLFIGQLVDPR